MAKKKKVKSAQFYRDQAKCLARVAQYVQAKKAQKDLRKKVRSEKRQRKHRLEQLDSTPTVMSPESVTALLKSRTEARRQQKELKESRRKGRILAKKARVAEKEQARVEASQEKRLERNGWKKTQKGWRWGNHASLPLQEAIAQLNRQERCCKVGAKERVANYLKDNGWSDLGGNVWMIPNWEKEGNCYRTLAQAYKIQLGLGGHSEALHEAIDKLGG